MVVVFAFVVVVIIDLLSMMIRSFVNDEGDVRRPTWLNFILTPKEE